MFLADEHKFIVNQLAWAVSKKPDPGSRTSSALEANQFANQFGSRGKPVREPVRL